MSNELIAPETKYDSAGITNTHQAITLQAVNALKASFQELVTEDSKAEMKAVLAFMESKIETLKQGSIDPDYGKTGIDSDYALYQDHFFDPDTGKNFTSLPTYPSYEIKDTAESQARNYFCRAIATYRDGNKEFAIRLLGRALHYFEDANEPHHASNITGGEGTAHTKFERYAEGKKGEHLLEKVRDMKLYNQFSEEAPVEFISKMVYKHARMAKALKDKVMLNNSWADWDNAMEIAIKNAQEGVAIILFRFIKEIVNPTEVKMTNPLGKFHVVVKVAGEKNAGTDDLMHFGIRGKNKNTKEFTLDLPGNDFEYNSTGNYQCTSMDIKPQDISSVYLRKDNTMGIDNQVKIEYFEVYFHGVRVLRAEANKWLSSSSPLEYQVTIK